MVIEQVFPGFPAAPHAQYVTLRLQALLQTAVYSQPLPTYDAAGNPTGSFGTFCSTPRSRCVLPAVSPACSAGGCPAGIDASGSRILIATLWAQDLFCVTADLLASGSVPHPDGRVCFGDCTLHPDCPPGPVDCVAYGNFSGDNGIFGQPAMSPSLGEALVGLAERRNQFNPPGGTLLDSAAGFTIGAPTPHNFRGDAGALDGLAGDPGGDGAIDTDDVEAEARVLFETGQRCALAAARRGADANLDTRVSAADVLATIQIVTSTG